jgi:hypothetical protein
VLTQIQSSLAPVGCYLFIYTNINIYFSQSLLFRETFPSRILFSQVASTKQQSTKQINVGISFFASHPAKKQKKTLVSMVEAWISVCSWRKKDFQTKFWNKFQINKIASFHKLQILTFTENPSTFKYGALPHLFLWAQKLCPYYTKKDLKDRSNW